MMKRHEALLAVLATARGRPLTPVQLQKAMFLVTKNIPWLIDDGPSFHFKAYDYGPFDKAVYEEASLLEQRGLADIRPAIYGRWNTYAASESGIEAGDQKLAELEPAFREYLHSVTDWVRAQSFSSLVKSIYDAYPDMRANSIFQG